MGSNTRMQLAGIDQRDGAVLDSRGSDVVSVARATFPAEIWIIVTEFLAGQHALGSLAKLAMVNRTLEAVAAPILYATMTIPDLTNYCSRTKGSRPALEGFHFTKFLIVDRFPTDLELPHRLMPNLKMIITELGNHNTCSIYISKPINISTIIEVLDKTARNHFLPPSARGHFGKYRVPLRWLGSITIMEGGSLCFDAVEGYLSSFKHLQILPHEKIVFRKGHLQSLWSYWIWMGHHLPMTLTSISIILVDSEDDEYCCGRGSSDRLVMDMTLSSDELKDLLEMMAKTLDDGPAMLFDYPNIVLKGSKRTEVDMEHSLIEIQETFNARQGVFSVILPKGDAAHLGQAVKVTVNEPKSTLWKSFLIVVE